MSSSAVVPCEGAAVLYGFAVSFAGVAVGLALTSFTMYAWTLHKNPGRHFVSTTKFDVDSSSWVLVLTAVGALFASAAALTNYQCGTQCAPAIVQCNTSVGTAGTAMIAALSAMCAAGLKIMSFFFQMKMANPNPLAEVRRPRRAGAEAEPKPVGDAPAPASDEGAGLRHRGGTRPFVETLPLDGVNNTAFVEQVPFGVGQPSSDPGQQQPV